MHNPALSASRRVLVSGKTRLWTPVHGGWFNWGSAPAFRNFAGRIALSAGADAFIPDYRLAPACAGCV
ncbi:MAG: alpha/beta hydrolase [Acidobacteriia bacterium]|nr:alpha/beta hydrolase [Terriglobia bacterium]